MFVFFVVGVDFVGFEFEKVFEGSLVLGCLVGSWVGCLFGYGGG